MAIAGAVVVPLKKDFENRLKEKLNSMSGVEIQDIGKKGIAVVLEADDTDRIKEISKEINGWEEVIDFQLGYLNWEEVKDKER